MSSQEDRFLDELRATFKIEAGEHLQAIAAGLLELEKVPAPVAQSRFVETVFRAAHSLKGAARAVDFTEIESLCQSLEDVFASWKRREGSPSREALDALHRVLDAITAALAASNASRRGDTDPGGPPPERSARQWENSAPPDDAPSSDPLAGDASPAGQTVRIAVAKLDARLLAAEEMLSVKLTTGRRAVELRELAQRCEVLRKQGAAVELQVRALRQSLYRPAPGGAERRAVPQLDRLWEFFDAGLDQLKSLENGIAALSGTTEQDRLVVSRLVDDLLEDSKKLLLLPFATIAASFPKLVRDLCRDQGKDADLVIRGEDVEIDKRVLEEMKDPLIHLLRNCIDHGIEASEQRLQAGKPAKGTITLAASRVNGSKVELLVSDDGAGVDAEKVKASAVRHGILPAEDVHRLGTPDALGLVFRAEVSASPIVTRLSGRGLGLAIVREKAEGMGGAVTVESEPRVGTRFRILLPAMLATFRGILLEAAGQLFVVPTVHVERVARLRRHDVQTVEGRETVSLNGRAVALARLDRTLELPLSPQEPELPSTAFPVIVLGTGGQRMAFAVDAVLDEQEVLVKPLRKPLERVRNLAGATMLGSGRVALILNVADLLKSARKAAGAAAQETAEARPAQAPAKSILVVEDSITSRMLLKGILESAGYKVRTAVDGAEAFALLRTERFDLVVSDVEMPRLNGFDLTASIRADRRLAELPVVLVTALETREDRERGIDVGANAYLLKSSFDQGDLLASVRRLV